MSRAAQHGSAPYGVSLRWLWRLRIWPYVSRYAASRQRVPRQAVAAGTVLLLVAGLCAGVDLVFPPEAAATSSATTITAGWNHSCMLRGAKAYCWGDNSYGELGNDSTISSGVPAAVYTGGVLSGVTLTSITAGQYFTCALSSAGAVYCWGGNNLGQLGNNSTANSDVPVAVNMSGVLSGKTITQLSAGASSGSTMCVLSSGGAAYCWGSGGLGQLGNNSYYSSSVPVAVNTSGVLSGVTLTQISTGGIGACVLSSAGAAYCWGYGNYGQLGNGTFSNVSVPVAVTTSGVLSGVTLSSIALGSWHACALSTSGTAYCWGYNPDGELGNNSTTNSDVPVAVSTSGVLSGVTLGSIGAGNGETCALSSAGAAYCWGFGSSGQLGNSATSSSSLPVTVTATGVLSGAPLSQIAAGGNFTCAVDSFGTVYCWGTNSAGQDGNTTTNPSTNFAQPVVVSPPEASTLATGLYHACDLRAGKAYCWGDDTYGELGNNTTSTTAQSTPVAVYTGGVLSGVTLTQIVAGYYSTCALGNTGTAYCWGYNSDGELGNNSTTNSDVPVAVYAGGALSGRTLTQMSGGASQTCVLSSASAADCWGLNSSGQLGDNNTTNSDVPVAITVSTALTGKVIAAIYGGYAHGCAVDTAGNAFCWGSNGSGALGNNSITASSVAVAVYTGGALSASTYIVAMGALGYDSSGNASTCALGANGLAYCWGTNTDGELGNNSTTSSDVPVAVYTSGVLSGVALSQIVAGYDYSCALSTAGIAYCWGSNTNDTLGINSTSTTSSDVPVAVYTGGALSGLTLLQISASSSYFVCVLDSIGAVYCWGQNGDGQLGNSSTTSSDAPVEVVGLVPGAPTSVASFPANNSASVYWAAPSSFGTSGSATGYTATASPGGAACTTSGLTCTLTGLTNGTTYTVTVVTNTTGGPSYASSPATVTAWPPDTAISAGFSNTCVLQSGLAYCWGDNTYGEAGINSTTVATELSPVAVYTGGVLSGLTLTQIVSGEYFTCALSSAGAVYCWGYNSNGQLGNGTTTSSSVPVAVTTSGTPMSGATITQISANQYTVCALSSAGAEYCWGGNSAGQLGNNSTTNSDVPVAVTTSGVLSGLTLVQISVGWQSNCSLASTGAVYCWGDGSFDELGNNATSSSSVPVAVYTGGGLSGVQIATISTGWTEACAVSSTGAAYCWGNGQYGGLGNNSTASSDVPVAVSTSGVLSGVTLTQIAGGEDGNVCALSAAGAAYCWGYGAYGELGNNSTSESNVPVAVSTSGVLSGVTLLQLSSGHQYECALASTGTSGCFGTGVSGDLGNNNGSANASTAVVVTPQAPLSVTTTAGNTTLAVSWTAPAYLNTGTLTSYTATASPGGATCTSTSATSCTITGLTDGTSYTITVTTTATISGTSAPSIAATGTPVGLAMTGPTSLTWIATGNGLNESIVDSVSGDQQLTVGDGTGSGAGWHITMSATTFTAGSRTLPNSGAMDVNGSVTSLTGVAPSAACVSSCTLPANTTTYPVALTTAATSPSTYTIYDTSASTGIGAVIIGGSSASHPVGWWVNVPASAAAGSYTSTVSLTLVSGP